MAIVDLLAALPDPGGYLHPVKLVIMLVLFSGWLFFCQWVNRDTRLVNTHQMLWNAITLATGVTGLLLWLLIPLFSVGLVVFVLISGGGMAAYVVHRNGLVVEHARLLTPGHFTRLLSQRGAGKSQEVEELVRLTDYDGRQVRIPEESVERQQYGMVQDLLHDILWRRASDVDVAVAGQQARVVYRIDGVAVERDPIPAASTDMILMYLKKLAGLAATEHRRPQSGHITASMGSKTKDLDKMVKIEVKTSGSTAGERLMLRVLAEESRFKIDDLGLMPQQLSHFQSIIDQPRGLVLCCGPRQSGLTSTLYAILRSHDVFMKNIHTLELQLAMDLENVTQNVYDQRKTEVSFARRVQTILRADPDVVMVAAVPDSETAVLTTEAAGGRIKLYVGLEVPDCIKGLQKWLSLVEDRRLVARSLLAISAQRLVRRLCPQCRQAYKPDPETVRKANLPADRIEKFYRRSGYLLNKKGEQIVCETCQGSGYFGRTAIFEILMVTDDVRKLIAGGASINQIKSVCRKGKPPMLYLQEQGIRQVMAGVTSINEVIRVTREGQNRSSAR